MQHYMDNYHSYLPVGRKHSVSIGPRTQGMKTNISMGSIGSGQHKTLGVYTGQSNRNEIISHSN